MSRNYVGATTEERISKLVTVLQESTQVITAIEAEKKERQVLAEKLKQDLSTYNELVKLREPEVEAVAQLLCGELKKEGTNSLGRDILVSGFSCYLEFYFH